MDHRHASSSPARPADRIWTPEVARRLPAEWQRSGQSLAVFSRRRGFFPQRLSWWRKRLASQEARHAEATRAAPPAGGGLVPLTVRPGTRSNAAATIELGDTLRVELGALDRAGAAWIADLVKALGGAP